MGCGASNATPESAKSLQIDKQLKDEGKTAQRTIKVLLLGTGASGKTTVCKQMRLLFLKGYSDKEARAFAAHIIFSLLRNSIALCQTALAWGLVFEERLQAHVARLAVTELSVGVELDKETGLVLAALWKDAAAVNIMKRRNETDIDDSYQYFMERVVQIATPAFVPSVDDILHCRVKTLGIVEMKFNYQGSDFMMVDVGGQRTERRKWIHAFGDVTLLMFVASLADYSTACEEDRKTNRLLESLKLFEEVVNNVFLAHVSLVIFYNKNDLFEEQLPLIPFASYHTEYTGENSCVAVREYVKKRFEACNKSKPTERSVYSHVTCATDTKQIEVVWRSVADVFLSSNLQLNGFSMS